MPPRSSQYLQNTITREYYRYETSTMCPECGRLGSTWTVDIYNGNQIENIRYRNNEFGVDNLTCKICNAYNAPNIEEHIRIIKELIINKEKETTEEELNQILIQASNMLNEKIRKNTEQNKPPSGANRTITGKNHRRFQLGNAKGIECIQCIKLFSIKDETDLLICPHCGKEQIINKKQIINL